jgi:hypothetical protein
MAAGLGGLNANRGAIRELARKFVPHGVEQWAHLDEVHVCLADARRAHLHDDAVALGVREVDDFDPGLGMAYTLQDSAPFDPSSP